MCIRHATSTKSPLPVAMIEAPLLARLVSRSRCPSREPPRHARARPRAVLEASVTRPTEEEPTRAPQAPPSNDDVHEDPGPDELDARTTSCDTTSAACVASTVHASPTARG
jgi:hypothetical protein